MGLLEHCLKKKEKYVEEEVKVKTKSVFLFNKITKPNVKHLVIMVAVKLLTLVGKILLRLIINKDFIKML